MKVFNVSLPLFLSLCFFAYGQGSDAVYFNGTILTMEDGQGTAQALAVKDGRITFVGSWDDAQEFITARTVRVDLHNGTLLPGFIDVHGHITSAALWTQRTSGESGYWRRSKREGPFTGDRPGRCRCLRP